VGEGVFSPVMKYISEGLYYEKKIENGENWEM
jgi:hypothetical protein